MVSRPAASPGNLLEIAKFSRPTRLLSRSGGGDPQSVLASPAGDESDDFLI